MLLNLMPFGPCTENTTFFGLTSVFKGTVARCEVIVGISSLERGECMREAWSVDSIEQDVGEGV